MKRWDIQYKIKAKSETLDTNKIIEILLKNRGLTDTKDIEEFLHPKLENVTIEKVGINKKELKKAVKRIQKAIDNREQIFVYGDYDVDGITGTAILWETLDSLKARALPYIPHRIDEGYGLSEAGIKNIMSQIPDIKLIITVDNGIVADNAVEYAKKQGIDVIITDHHTVGEKPPAALAIVHTTKLCGAGVAYLLSQELKRPHPNPLLKGEGALDTPDTHDTRDTLSNDSHLELATLGTVADLVPLTGANRTIVKYGLEKVCHTSRPGLIELFKEAGCLKDVLGVYEIGFIIAPRLNAAGRIESAMDSLRLLCTHDKRKARLLAEKLELTNRERQLLMKQAAEHASLSVKTEEKLKKILIVSHESYQQGVIGLVAGKLVEEFYRPSIVISKGEKYSKASARSITGFNIIEFLRSTPDYFINVGGHPMAAGFTIETEKLEVFKKTLETLAEDLLDGDSLTKRLKIDCELPLSAVNNEFYISLQQLAPFGMANPEPVFAARSVTVTDMRVLGKLANHLKLVLTQDNTTLEAIAFGMGELAREIKIGSKIDIAYAIDENTWNGKTKLQLKIKDIMIQ